MISYVITVYVTGVILMIWMWWVAGVPSDPTMTKDEESSGFLSQALFWPFFLVIGTAAKLMGLFDEQLDVQV